MQLHFVLLAIFSIVTLSLLDYSDALIFGRGSRWFRWGRCRRNFRFWSGGSCPVNGGWNSWSSWSKSGSCSASCRTNKSSSNPQQKYYKTRSCNNPTPRHGGRSCSGSSVQYTYFTCNTHYCKIIGGWSSWSSWRIYGSCSASCRKCGSFSYPQRKYYKSRSCNNPTPQHGGRSCSGSSVQYKYLTCNTHYCRINGGWESWTSWGKWNRCSADCRKEGSSAPTKTRSRSRMCNNPSPRCNGKSCSGSSLQYNSQTCNTHCCRVDGGWGSWTSWGTGNRCSADCRTEGSSAPTLTRSRSRMCSNPSPRCNGKSCSGSSLQSNRQTCNTQHCPVDGGWKPFEHWSDWSDCSKSCDGGSRRRTRKRSCTNPSPKYGGTNCTGSDSEPAVETCNTFTCPNFCTCDGSGYPHYYTPDGALIDFMGTCKYTLWNSTIPNDPCEFRVETKNERRHGNSTVAWTRFIDFYIKNIKIRISKGGTTVINGIQVSLPIKIGSSNIEISRSGSYVTAVSSECNIRVQFDGNQLVSVKVPRDYFGGKLAGICGNCNGNYSDDLQTKDGKDVSLSGRRGHSDIGNSYKVFDDADGPDSSCDDASPIVSIPEDDKEKSENVCEYLVSDSSPFKACRESNKLNFTNMYESCEYDVAVSTLDDAHCPTLQSTALACSRHGYPVHWRTSNFCPLACDGDFVYKTSVSCTNTCDKPKADQNCLDPPVDGCTCPDNTYLSADRCVAIDKCGSCNLVIGPFSINLAVGDVFPKGDCRNSQRCDLNNGTFKIVSVPVTKQCSSGEWCILNGLGEYNCAKTPVHGGWENFGLWSDWSDCSKSCDGGSRRRTQKRSCTNPSPKYGGNNCAGADSETAVETCNTFRCPDYCTCDGSGDQHYYTPDGAVIHFMGTCKYTLWNSTIANDPCEFRIETKNERRHGNSTVAWTRFIDFYMKNTKIRFLRGGITLVNGIQVSLPNKDGSSNIEISRSGSYVTAFSSECSIRVQFDGNHLVSVKAERAYYGGQLAGICGNCNGIYGDDLQAKDGKDVSSLGRRGHSDIGNSYKVFDDVEDPDSSCDDGTPLVEIPDKDRVKTEKVCEYLVSDSSPFKACKESNKLNFTQMYESCEYDVAVSTLDDAHCLTLQSTALACSRHGFPVHWRTSTFCPLACDGDFVYKTSVSCTNSCDKPKADQYCLDPPVDGCTCPDDTYLSADRCVAIDKCGSCNLTVGLFSTNLAIGDVFPKGNCRNSQRCDLNNGTFKSVSVPASKQCSAGEWCVLNGLGEYNCAKKPDKKTRR